jgi:hypothetical protein
VVFKMENGQVQVVETWISGRQVYAA